MPLGRAELTVLETSGFEIADGRRHVVFEPELVVRASTLSRRPGRDA